MVRVLSAEEGGRNDLEPRFRLGAAVRGDDSRYDYERSVKISPSAELVVILALAIRETILKATKRYGDGKTRWGSVLSSRLPIGKQPSPGYDRPPSPDELVLLRSFEDDATMQGIAESAKQLAKWLLGCPDTIKVGKTYLQRQTDTGPSLEEVSTAAFYDAVFDDDTLDLQRDALWNQLLDLEFRSVFKPEIRGVPIPVFDIEHEGKPRGEGRVAFQDYVDVIKVTQLTRPTADVFLPTSREYEIEDNEETRRARNEMFKSALMLVVPGYAPRVAKESYLPDFDEYAEDAAPAREEWFEHLRLPEETLLSPQQVATGQGPGPSPGTQLLAEVQSDGALAVKRSPDRSPVYDQDGYENDEEAMMQLRNYDNAFRRQARAARAINPRGLLDRERAEGSPEDQRDGADRDDGREDFRRRARAARAINHRGRLDRDRAVAMESRRLQEEQLRERVRILQQASPVQNPPSVIAFPPERLSPTGPSPPRTGFVPAGIPTTRYVSYPIE